MQETAAGVDEIETWPDLSFLDWCLEAVYVAAAFAYSMTPGIVLSVIMTRLGIPPAVGLIFSMFSLFALFPVVLLSLMEADSLAAPLTKPILASLQKERSHWCIFYLESVVILIVILVAGSLIYMNSGFALLLAAMVWSFCWLVYFRLLGRLAWISGHRMRSDRPAEIARNRTMNAGPMNFDAFSDRGGTRFSLFRLGARDFSRHFP